MNEMLLEKSMRKSFSMWMLSMWMLSMWMMRMSMRSRWRTPVGS